MFEDEAEKRLRLEMENVRRGKVTLTDAIHKLDLV